MAHGKQRHYFNPARAQAVLDKILELYNCGDLPAVRGRARRDALEHYGLSLSEMVGFIVDNVSIDDYFRTNKDDFDRVGYAHHVFKPCFPGKPKSIIFIKIMVCFTKGFFRVLKIMSFKPDDKG